jgi:acetylornithine deacetylase/succinyl-diaminopimelate desuccinylase-like protein
MGAKRSGAEFLEAGVSKFLMNWFQERDIACEYQEVAPGRANVLARRQGAVGSPTILLDAHQDTVPVDGMTISPFDPVVANGRVHGRGSCDVKGGMAAMLAAFSAIVRDSTATVVMACTCDEELGQLGVRHLTSSWSSNESKYQLLPSAPDFAIVAEPTDLNVVTSHKGTIRWALTTRGVSAHSSSPQQGENAIYHMARIVRLLRQYSLELSQRVAAHDPCGTASLSVGVIHGGTSVNIVPDHCEIQIDRRLLPGETPDDAEQDLQNWLRDQDVHPFTMIRIGCTGLPLSPTAASAIPATQLLTMIKRHQPKSKAIGVPFCTHASTYAAAGVPAVVFGPGSIRNAHSADESISIDEVRHAAAILEQFLNTDNVLQPESASA